jgi:hypothetical protein
MNTIVVNTLSGAVTEYTNFGFDSITPTHAGSALGLYALGGNTDVGAPIVSQIRTGKAHWGTALKKYIDVVFFAIKGTGLGRLHILGETAAYNYNFALDKDGESRCQPGRGIRENYLAFGFSNPDGKDFQLDRMDANIGTSGTRRTQ